MMQQALAQTLPETVSEAKLMMTDFRCATDRDLSFEYNAKAKKLSAS
jgi:hypothetical protein